MSRLSWSRRLSLAAALALAVMAPPAHARSDWNDPSCPGIQPGATMTPAVNAQYPSSWGFLFSDGRGGVYTFVNGTTLSTMPNASAQVNLAPTDTERTWRRGSGPAVTDGMGRIAGHAVWYRWYQTETWYPRALVQVDAGRAFRGEVCALGGPRTIDASITNLPEQVAIYGQGGRPIDQRVRQDLLPYGAYDSDAVCLARTHVESGDAGAPIESGDGQAFGMVSDGSALGPDDVHRACGQPAFRLGPMIQWADRALHIKLTLLHRSGVAR